MVTELGVRLVKGTISNWQKITREKKSIWAEERLIDGRLEKIA
jgi:hypothetical protein